MKLLNRFILLIITLLFMFTVLVLAIYSFGFTDGEAIFVLLDNIYKSWQIGILFLLAFLVGAWVLYPFFTMKDDRTFTEIKSTELGEINISIRALENLVEGIVYKQDKIDDIDIKLNGSSEGLEIFIAGDVEPGTVISQMTNELQQVVKSYIEDTTGVTVKEVKVLINDINENEATRVD